MSSQYHHHQIQQPQPQPPSQASFIPPIYATSSMNIKSMNDLSPPQHKYYQELQQAYGSPGVQGTSGVMLPVNGDSTGSMNSISLQHQEQYYQPVQHAQGPPVCLLPRVSDASSVTGALSQHQLQNQQYQTQLPQSGLGVLGALHPVDSNDVFTSGAETPDVDDQSQHLWYWIEVIKPFTFHDAYLSPSEASRLATLYLSKLPAAIQLSLPSDAHSSIAVTLLSESTSLLRYLVLGILFPLIQSWTSTPHFRRYISRPNTTRSQRLSYWREKALSPAGDGAGVGVTALDKFTEVLDTMLDRKWVYGVSHGGDRKARAMRMKMQGYLMWKFVLSADVVFVELVLRLGVEPYSKERWREAFFPAMLPKLMAINRDPNIVPFIVEPENWPSTLRIDEDVMNRCVALIGSQLG